MLAVDLVYIEYTVQDWGFCCHKYVQYYTIIIQGLLVNPLDLNHSILELLISQNTFFYSNGGSKKMSVASFNILKSYILDFPYVKT